MSLPLELRIDQYADHINRFGAILLKMNYSALILLSSSRVLFMIYRTFINRFISDYIKVRNKRLKMFH